MNMLVKFLYDNAAAFFALVGTLGGGFLTFCATIFYKEYDFKLGIKKRIFEKRISAHEEIISIVNSLRKMISMQIVLDDGSVKRYPEILESRSHFHDFVFHFNEVAGGNSTWLSKEVERELSFVQDYVLTVSLYLEKVEESEFHEIGNIIRDDFVQLASELEKNVKRYFHKGVFDLDRDETEMWHKYKKEETHRRLNETQFMKKSNELDKYIKRA